MMSKLQEKSARIVAIMNNKGGPGKTSSATNLAVHFARTGKRTLLIDSDQQANTTESDRKWQKVLFHVRPYNLRPL
ncbi:Sporulation initiation inhibitor protein soj [Escherichia coli]|nr:Sporulation initiation inhibitor protein soj [Escherichia coli]